MNWLVYHIVSGHAFFTGVTLLVIAALASTRPAPVFSRITVLLFCVGMIAVIVSSTAIPYWYYAVGVGITVAWIASWFKKQWRCWTPYAVVVFWIAAAIIELPWHFAPSLNPVLSRNITVIGDSVTAGVGGNERSETWPEILAREHDLDVQDISHVGETAASALKRAGLRPISSPVVVLEIGGNDLLGSTTSRQFAIDLDALLTFVSRNDRQVVMFELPLPPFCHEYGRIQRSLAVKHGVALVPKRIFLSVIAGSNSTLDSIHLSQSGHQLMADCVWQLVRSAFAPTKDL